MKSQLLLCLALVLSGTHWCCSRAGIPPIETVQNSALGQSVSNIWLGHTFSQIIPTQEIAHIILLADRDLRSPFLPKPSAQEIQSYWSQLFSHLERSNQKTCTPYLADYEGTRAQFAVITRSGDVFNIQALSGLAFGSISGMLISNHRLETRINLKDYQALSATNLPAGDTISAAPSVETDYLLNQKPGNWVGLRFSQIIPLRNIKRIVLLDEYSDMLDYFPKEPSASAKRRRQIGYGELLDGLASSHQKAGAISLSKYEFPLARLLLFTRSDGIICLEIIEASGQIEHGSTVGNHIAGVLIHGPGNGVRINLNVFPISPVK